MDVPPEYRRLDEAGVRGWLAGIAPLAARLGGAPSAWAVREVSDGNLNVVWLVDGAAGGVCIKQAIPHVRLDRTWRLPLDRAAYEVAWMRQVFPHVGRAIPELLHFDPKLFVIAMEQLSPHIILRQGFIRGIRYPRVAADVGRFIAKTAFFTSDLAMPFERKFEAMARFARNEVILRITVDLILTDPYRDSARNRWTRPFVDDLAQAFRDDAPLKVEVSRLGHRFLSCTQALLHGDLHSGSVMVTEHESRVVDGEFAMYGPIGFDLGAFLGNLLLAWFSQPGHEAAPDERAPYRGWLLAQIVPFWRAFESHFLELWRAGGGGDAYVPALFADDAGTAALDAERARFLREVWADTLGYAGMKMIRRLLGYARVADFETIPDPERRAALERRALAFARRLLVERERIDSPDTLLRLLAA